MSNAFAIATVTAALSEVIEGAIKRTVGGAKVKIGRPNAQIADSTDPMVGLYLYQVRPNAALRNQWQPVRSGSGRVLQRPYVALDLYYLVTLYGDSEKYIPELMAAEVVRALEARPILTRGLLASIAEKDETVEDSDLAKAREEIRATPLSMDLEDLSKLWSIFFQVPYALSLPYLLSYVIVESEELPRSPLPVTRPSLTLWPMTRLQIDSIEGAQGETSAIVWGKSIFVRGRGLDKPGLEFHIDGKSVKTKSRESQRVEVELIDANLDKLQAGVHTAQVVEVGKPKVPLKLARRSDCVPFLLRPTLTLEANPIDGNAKTITVKFSPPLVEGQTARLLLDELADEPESYALEANLEGATFPLETIIFSYDEIKAGDYLVSAVVSGVTSAFEIQRDPSQGDFGHIVGPKVTFP